MGWFWETLVTLHGILLGLFVCSTAVLLVATCLNRLRVRNVLFSWGRGRFLGFPLSPTLLLSAVTGLLVHTLVTGQTGPVLTPLVLIAYVAGGLFWYVTSILGETVVVTEYGLVHDMRRLSTSIPWSRIVDYAEIPEKGSGHYALFFMDGEGNRKRVDIRIPGALRDRFRTLIRHRLDARIDYVMNARRGSRALQP